MIVDSNCAALLVRLGDRYFGLPLASVERVLPMATVLPLPDTSDGLLGVLNLHGNVLPVIDAHARLGVEKPSVAADHQLVLLRGARPFLMWVDEVQEVVAFSADTFSAVPTRHENPVISTVFRLGESIVPLLAPAALEPHGATA